MRRVALYLRVSTADQTTQNQEREFAAIAALMGRQVVSKYTDEGTSGSKGREKRPAFHALHGIADEPALRSFVSLFRTQRSGVSSGLARSLTSRVFRAVNTGPVKGAKDANILWR